jgi:carboxylesterase
MGGAYVPLLPGAEPLAIDGGPIGALVLHGFTGTPQGVRDWGLSLAEAGLTVTVPRLPGHGTRWQDMSRTRWTDWYAEAERAFDELRRCCAAVFVCGLSMGGTLTLRLAEQRAGEIAGAIVVNASLATERKDAKVLPLLRHVIPAMPGVANDIRKVGVTELAYSKFPLQAAYSLSQLWALTRADLAKITCPVLSFRSQTDHVVEAVSGTVLREGAVSTSVTERLLLDSYHVATLDNDAPEIFAESTSFVRAHSGVRAGSR